MNAYLKAPSVATLKRHFPLTPSQAKRLRSYLLKWRDAPFPKRAAHAENALDYANEALDAHGIEAIRDENGNWDPYFGDVVALYVNRGDTYDTTLLYDLRAEDWYVTSWGDWLEIYERRPMARRS